MTVASEPMFSARYERNPLGVHEPVHARTPSAPSTTNAGLELFDTTVDELFAGPTAEVAQRRGRRMAKAMGRLLQGQADTGDAAVAIVWGPTPGRSQQP